MTALEFVTACDREGVNLQVVGDKIRASGRAPRNPEKFGAYLRSRKTELVELLAPCRTGPPETSRIADEPQKAPSVPQDTPMPALGTDVLPETLDSRLPWPSTDTSTDVGRVAVASRMLVSLVLRGAPSHVLEAFADANDLELPDAARVYAWALRQVAPEQS